MHKLAPLSAAIVLALAGQAMADDSVSTQNQQGAQNIAEVKQSQAPFASATQNQTGHDHNHMALQDASTSHIQQSATGSFNAGYAEQLYENGSQITQHAGGELNDAFASQSVGENNEALQIQAGDSTIRTTVSIGVASRLPRMADTDAMVKAADQALYRAKEGGRNRSCVIVQGQARCLP